jgi:hypothetical protein
MLQEIEIVPQGFCVRVGNLVCRTTSVGHLGLGAASGLLASSICFPLDTVRRQMQMRACTYTSQIDAISTIWRTVTNLFCRCTPQANQRLFL